jgi:predicted enzyme related to lactoylglutathione lyase
VSHEHHQINYVELPATDLAATKSFYAAAFGWSFHDWGPGYASFAGAGLDGGFTTETAVSGNGPLVVLYSDDVEASLEAVVAAGGTITQAIYSFPGGRRFHFRDPNGNELAVWGDEVPAA